VNDNSVHVTFDAVVPRSPLESAEVCSMGLERAPRPVFEFQADMPASGCIDGTWDGSYPTPARHDDMMLRRIHGNLRSIDEHPAAVPLDELVDAAVSARLRAIVQRLRTNSGGLVPDAEVYVRVTLATAIEETLEER
jgi:hypothetical protein